MDELRPLEPASYNAFYEVWTRIAKIPPGERHRLLEALDPGCCRSLWKASVGRYVLDAARASELFAAASVWDDFPDTPGQVFTYEGRAEKYDIGGGSGGGGGGGMAGPHAGPTITNTGGAADPGRRRSVRLEIDSERTAAAAAMAGDGRAAAPWLRPVLSAVDVPVMRFRQHFFMPPEGSFDDGRADGSESLDGGGGGMEGQRGWRVDGGAEPDDPIIYSRVVLPLMGPLDRWWEARYSRLRVQLVLTPLPADAGADLQLLYPADPECGHEGAPEERDDGGNGQPYAGRLGNGSAREPGQAAGREATGGGASGLGEGEEPRELGPWELVGSRCLPPGRWWPEPDPLEYPVSPFSGGPRDYLRVVGPGVYVGCAYRSGPGPGEYREENFVYFVIARRE